MPESTSPETLVALMPSAYDFGAPVVDKYAGPMIGSLELFIPANDAA